jgi:hypothetical protein
VQPLGPPLGSGPTVSDGNILNEVSFARQCAAIRLLQLPRAKMRGKLALMRVTSTVSSASNVMQRTAGGTPTVFTGGIVSRIRWLVAGMIGLAALLLAEPVFGQGNLDAGKSPAQIFADTCAGCHRRPQEVRRATAGFLRSHYTTGSVEAAAMARYIASVPNEPRSAPGERKKGANPKETPSEPTASRRQQNGESKETRGAAGSSKGHRAGAAEAKSSATASAAAPEVKPPEPAVEEPPPPPPAAVPPPPPPLEPFEE